MCLVIPFNSLDMLETLFQYKIFLTVKTVKINVQNVFNRMATN